MTSEGGGSREPVPRKVSALENDAGYISEEKAGDLLSEYPKTIEVNRIVNTAVESIPAGASAYESALQNGFEGTEAEWLDSLHGEQGPPGKDGKDGEDGAPGKAAAVRIGTVTTGPPGTEASVVNTGTENEAVLDFTIPRGEKGNPGSSGGMTVDLIATLEEVKQNEAAGMAADALAVKELAGFLPFRLGVDSGGNYGYYKDGADTVTPFRTGDGGGMETVIGGLVMEGYHGETVPVSYSPVVVLTGTIVPETEGVEFV